MFEKFGFLVRDFLSVVRSVLPLTAVLVAIKVIAFGSSWASAKQTAIGVVFATIGLFLFLEGIQMSLLPLAELTGEGLAKSGNRTLILAVTFLIGLSATLVEPGLRAVVQEAETVSVGAIKSRVLLFATAVGVAIGMALGIAKIIYGWKTAWVVLPFLGLLILLILRAPDTFTALAWDCASATTGPVNIPINMMIALGVSRSIEGSDPLLAGFGLVGLTSLGAATAVLLLGLTARA